MLPIYEEGKELLRKIINWWIDTQKYSNEQWRINILDDLNRISVDCPREQ
jgi:hypothetical protein